MQITVEIGIVLVFKNNNNRKLNPDQKNHGLKSRSKVKIKEKLGLIMRFALLT